MKRTSLSTSVRRHFVDEFFFSNAHLIKKESRVIDIGGKSAKKRGLFDADIYGAEVTYVNIEEKDRPDIIADAENIPVPDSSYDIAIMGELLEHVPEPKAVLKEAYRILKPEGRLLASVPFLFPIHADPYDYGRYTETYWKEAAQAIGFRKIEIERQGTLFAVVALAVQHYFRAPAGILKRAVRKLFEPILLKWLLWLDSRATSPTLLAWTTGYGISLSK